MERTDAHPERPQRAIYRRALPDLGSVAAAAIQALCPDGLDWALRVLQQPDLRHLNLARVSAYGMPAIRFVGRRFEENAPLGVGDHSIPLSRSAIARRRASASPHF